MYKISLYVARNRMAAAGDKLGNKASLYRQVLTERQIRSDVNFGSSNNGLVLGSTRMNSFETNYKSQVR